MPVIPMMGHHSLESHPAPFWLAAILLGRL